MALSWADERHITHRSFRIVDLAEEIDPIIRGRTFEDCTIYGPAVVLPLDYITLEHNSFDGAPEAVLWEIPDERAVIIGAIGLIDCIFRRCRFQGIGVAGKRPFIERFIKGLGTSTPSSQSRTNQPQEE
jgi:hypothetical protein